LWVKFFLKTNFHPQETKRAACGGTGRILRGDKN
jgi:hypothetical protein